MVSEVGKTFIGLGRREESIVLVTHGHLGWLFAGPLMTHRQRLKGGNEHPRASNGRDGADSHCASSFTAGHSATHLVC